MGEDVSSSLTEEGGLVENLTVWLYAVLLVVLIFGVKVRMTLNRVLCPFVILLLMLRELDFDKKFTEMGIFKSKFYKSADVPFMQKALAVVVIMIILVVVFMLLRQNWKGLLHGVGKRWRVECGIAVALLLAGVSKLLLDGLPRKLEKVGIVANDFVLTHHGTFEEVLELAIPISLLLAVFYLRTQSERGQHPSNGEDGAIP